VSLLISQPALSGCDLCQTCVFACL
jgi:hypothetical protein